MKTWPYHRLLSFWLAAICLTLAGCSGVKVSPVYNQRPLGVLSSDSTSKTVLNRPSVTSYTGIPPLALPLPTGRDGQVFHNALRDRLAPTGLPKIYAYELVDQSFKVSTQAIQSEIDSDKSLSRIIVQFSYRVNNVDVHGTRSLAFADSLSVHHDYVSAPGDSPYSEDARMTQNRNQAIVRMAEAVETSLQLQFVQLSQRAAQRQ